MALDTINLYKVGMDEVLIIYKKVWEASASSNSISMPQSFWVGLFPEAISTRQDKAVYLLGILCGDVLSYRAWVDDSIHSTNLRFAYIEAYGVSKFP